MEITELWDKDTEVYDAELQRRENRNRDYMYSLKDENLLLNFNLEAGRTSYQDMPAGIHGGWESPVCQLRGHFTGHFLSAAAMHYYSTGDEELKSKADHIVSEIGECQKANG